MSLGVYNYTGSSLKPFVSRPRVVLLSGESSVSNVYALQAREDMEGSAAGILGNQGTLKENPFEFQEGSRLGAHVLVLPQSCRWSIFYIRAALPVISKSKLLVNTWDYHIKHQLCASCH